MKAEQKKTTVKPGSAKACVVLMNLQKLMYFPRANRSMYYVYVRMDYKTGRKFAGESDAEMRLCCEILFAQL